VLHGIGSILPDASYGSHLFAGRQLPSLQQLIFAGDPDAGNDYEREGEFYPFLDDVGVARLAACCPALQRLLVPECLAHGVRLTPLLQLTALTELVLAGRQIDDELIAQQLVMFTRLKSLRVPCGWGLTDAGVKQLTALTGLSQLSLSECNVSAEMQDDPDFDDGDIHIVNLPVRVRPATATWHAACLWDFMASLLLQVQPCSSTLIWFAWISYMF
jgi:hypothetical protein